MDYPAELEVVCPHCGRETDVFETSTRGLYQGYCEHCGEWFEFNYDEALASEHDERRIDEIRDERLDR